MNSNYQKIFLFLLLTRPLNLLITALVTFVAILISANILPDSSTIFLAISITVSVAASGNVINDFFDIEIDKINRPDRPLPSGRLVDREVLVFYFLLNILSLVLASFLPQSAFSVVLLSLFLLFIYSYKFKGDLLIGNIVVAFCTGLVFIFGSIISGNIVKGIMPGIFAFLINLIRELVKDIIDVEGDIKQSLKTFPIVFGVKKTKKLVSVISFILFLTTLIPFLFEFYKIEYLLIVLFIVDLPLVYLNKILYEKSTGHLIYISSGLKLLMIFGLVAIYFGKM